MAEGVTMYLTEAIIKDLLNRLTNHFKSGTVVFDAWSGLSLKSAQRRGIKGTGATFGWSIDNPETIRQLAPELFLVEEITARRLTAYDKIPWWSRLLVSLTERSVALRRANRILAPDHADIIAVWPANSQSRYVG